jgi:uncharacterized iron-regulated membrane protein
MDRRVLLRLHRGIALVLAPLILLQAFTGTMLVFREQLGRWTSPAATAGTGPASIIALSTLVGEAERSTQPGYRVSRIFLPAIPGDPAFVHMTGARGSMRYAAIDPGTGQTLSTGSIWRFPFEAALQIHYRLMDGRLGMAIVLLNALALILMAGTGIVYWWPGRRRIAKALAVRSNAPPRARLRQWHRSIGVILTPLVLFSATTGAILIVPELIAPAAPAALAPPRAGAAQLDQGFAHAMTAFPAARVRDIRFPLADRIDVSFVARHFNTQAVDVVSVRLSDGALTKRLSAEDNPALWIKMLPLHSGTAMGLPGRIFLTIEGLALIVLALTGPVMWWQSRRRPAARSPAKARTTSGS